MQRARHVVVATIGVLLLAGCRDTSFPTAIDPVTVTGNGEVHTGWIFGPDGEPLELKYVIIDGMSIHEGDINLGRAGTVARTRAELIGRPEGPLYGVVIDGSNHRWGWGGHIPYDISSGFDATQRQYIFDAFALISGTTAGLQFVRRTSEDSYLYFQLHGSECNSFVGRQGGAQEINLTWDFCRRNHPSERPGVAAHEILHSLGMFHEQSRCDRTDYVTIHWDNISLPDDEAQAAFGQKCNSATDYFSYAEGSIMHYRPDAWSRNGQPTITSKRGLDYLMGQRTALHQTDVSTLNAIYQPFGIIPSISYPAGTPSLSWAAPNGALGYTIYMVRVYEEVNGYENWSTTWEDVTLVGTTTGLSIQDSQRTYTGQDVCYVYSEWYGYARYIYNYEVVASFPDNIRSRKSPERAMIAPATC